MTTASLRVHTSLMESGHIRSNSPVYECSLHHLALRVRPLSSMCTFVEEGDNFFKSFIDDN